MKKECVLYYCKTCEKSFGNRNPSRGKRFCSVKCIRYQGHKIDKTGTGFWSNATDEQKLEKLKSEFNRLVIKSKGCWAWKNRLDKAGYGRLGKGHKYLAHRISWIIHNGPIPEGLFICHHCDNPACTNPRHLFLGTPKDNSVDCSNKNRKHPSFGVSHYNVKLNEHQVKEIIALIKSKISQRNIALQFGVSPSTIQNIADGKTWKHVRRDYEEMDLVTVGC
jgi:hypothetical protein